MSNPDSAVIETDVAIVGGGVAGLWLLNLLRKRNIDALLFEQASLGGVQTMASQGMIHGGLKYALAPASASSPLSAAAKAIADMPQRWQDCFAGHGEIDLSAVELANPDYFMFASGSIGKLSSFFASKALRGKIAALEQKDFPQPLQHPSFKGHVYRLSDPVVDVTSLLHTLSQPHTDRLLRCAITGLRFDAAKNIRYLETDAAIDVRARNYIFCAGAGNQSFAEQLRHAGHEQAPATQLRPLHQVFVQHAELTPFYAHCLTGTRQPEPRLTITSHGHGREFGWYIGGALATKGIDRSSAAQIEFSRQELSAVLPWIDWQTARFRCLRVDRAEPAQTHGNKPDEACVVACANALLCWPTKLALAPNLGQTVLDQLSHIQLSEQAPVVAKSTAIDSASPSHVARALPAPAIAGVPWL